MGSFICTNKYYSTDNCQSWSMWSNEYSFPSPGLAPSFLPCLALPYSRAVQYGYNDSAGEIVHCSSVHVTIINKKWWFSFRVGDKQVDRRWLLQCDKTRLYCEWPLCCTVSACIPSLQCSIVVDSDNRLIMIANSTITWIVAKQAFKEMLPCWDTAKSWSHACTMWPLVTALCNILRNYSHCTHHYRW